MSKPGGRQAEILRVVYEDDAWIAFDKPAGLLAAPDRWDKGKPNLMRAVHERLSPDFFNAHRLDRETSGVVLCAKTRAALRALVAVFAARQARKTYVALVAGAPPGERGRVDVAIRPDPRHPGLMRTGGGKECATEYELTERWRGYALVTLRPLTGRTHQLRVHMASLGCPILADQLYGSGKGLYLSEIKPGYRHKPDQPERPLLGRLALHAQRLSVPHPVTGQPVTIEAPLPKDFTIALRYLRQFAA